LRWVLFGSRTTDEPRKLAEKLAEYLIEHMVTQITIPVQYSNKTIIVTVKYADDINLAEIDNAVIETKGIYG
jgi:hypothetical protein